ncbi:MAG: hypothetical protein II937_00445 [Bacteroidales bacterium]|nr:hypothetical protein [Bacteroidales bacterium]
MKKIITLIAIIASFCVNCNGQSHIYNNLFTHQDGDSIIYKIFGKNDTLPVILLRDTINEDEYVQYIIYDRYTTNNDDFFIFAKERVYNIYIDYKPITCSELKLYTTEPYTTVEMKYYDKIHGIKYIFYTDYRSKLTEKELELFQKRGLIDVRYY